jgi:hypothetical protein
LRCEGMPIGAHFPGLMPFGLANVFVAGAPAKSPEGLLGRDGGVRIVMVSNSSPQNPRRDLRHRPRRQNPHRELMSFVIDYIDHPSENETKLPCLAPNELLRGYTPHESLPSNPHPRDIMTLAILSRPCSGRAIRQSLLEAWPSGARCA